MLWKRTLLAAPRALLLLAVSLPVLLLARFSLEHEGDVTLQAYRTALTPEAAPLLGRSFALALGGTALAALLGTAGACALELRRFPLAPLLRGLALAPLVFPPFFHVAVWERLAVFLGRVLPGPQGPEKPYPIRSLGFAILVLGTSYAPLFLHVVSGALRSLPLELLWAARSTRSRAATAAGVALPLLLPALAAGVAIVLPTTLLSYEVPRLFEVWTYAVHVQLAHEADDLPGLGFAALLPLLLVAGAVALGAGGWARRRGFALAGRESRAQWRPERRAGLASWALFLLWWGFVAGLPVGGLISLLGGRETLLVAWRTEWEKILWGIGVAWGAGVLAAFLAALLLLPPAFEGRRRTAHFWIPLAIPGALWGESFLHLYQSRPLSVLATTPLGLVVAHALRFLPVAVLVLEAKLRTLPADEWRAAALVRGLPGRWGALYFPLVAPGLGAAVVSVALLAAGELPATLLLAPPGAEPVIVRIYNLVHMTPERDSLAALCLLQAGGMVAPFVLWRGLVRLRGRRDRG